MRTIWNEISAAFRRLRRSPSYSLAMIALLALGIGANAAMFTLARKVLLEPLPYRESERIVRIWETFSNGRGQGSVSAPNYRDWSDQTRSFESLAAFDTSSRNLQGVESPERLHVLESTASLAHTLGVDPQLGRFFTVDDEKPGAAPLVVLSNAFWRSRYGADPGVVGGTLRLDGADATIVGVLPAGFRFPLYGDAPDLYLPHHVSPTAPRGNHYLNVIGRLRDDATLDDARRELEQVSQQLAQAYPDAQFGRSVRLKTLAESIRGSVRPLLTAISGAVALVLLIVCANLGGLTLARSAATRRELAIRSALGAGRGRLVTRGLAEASLLAIGGAVGGGLVAVSLLELLRPVTSEILPDVGPVELDAAVFAFLLVVAGAAALLFGLVPALASARDDLARGLAESGTRTVGSRRSQRLRRLLVATQIALSLTLLVGAGLLLRTFVRLQSTPPGFDRVGVLTLHLSPSASLGSAAEIRDHFLKPLIERTRALPGVDEAGLVNMLPIQSYGSNSSYSIDGLEPPAAGDEWWVEMREASPGARAALGIPLRAGRDLAESDALAPGADPASVIPAMVNEAFVRRHFPNGDGLGRTVRFDATVAASIVGVYGDTRQSGLDQETLPELTVLLDDPRVSDSLAGTDLVLIVRSSEPPTRLANAIRATIHDLDPNQPVYTVRTVQQVLDRSLGDRRLLLLLVGAFAAVALVLAAIGLYALISYLVAQRTREVGIRMALGASAREIGRWVIREGLILLGLGAAAGLLGAWGASRLISLQLYGVGPFDPLTWLAVVVVLAAVTLLATLGPALRASRLDPAHVLRDE